MTTSAGIPDGIRPESNVIPMDSALNAVQGSAGQDKQSRISSRTDAQTRGRAIEQPVIARLNAIDRWDALAVVVAAMRPDWRITDVHRAITRDDRPPRDVIRAAIDAATDGDTRHPGAIAHRTAGSTTPTPPNLRRDEQCPTHLGEAAATCRGCAADRKARREETT